MKVREFQKNIYLCFIDYVKAFDFVDHNKLWKIVKEIGVPDHLTCLLRNLYAGQEATVRTRHGTRRVQTWERPTSRLYIATLLNLYLTTFCTSCKMLGWMNHKLESGLHREISITSGMQMIPPKWQKVKRN